MSHIGAARRPSSARATHPAATRHLPAVPRLRPDLPRGFESATAWTPSSPRSAPRSGRLSGVRRPAPLVGGGPPRRRMLDECDDAAGHESCGPHRRTRPGDLADLDEATASRDLDSPPGATRDHFVCPRPGSGVDDDLDPITLHTSTMRPTRTNGECPSREEPPAPDIAARAPLNRACRRTRPRCRPRLHLSEAHRNSGRTVWTLARWAESRCGEDAAGEAADSC
jgi:hypothetical protein